VGRERSKDPAPEVEFGSGFGFRVSDFGFRVSGLGFMERMERPAPGAEFAYTYMYVDV
jgi:hypothetical protein